MNKKVIYVGIGITLLGVAGFLYWKHKKKQKADDVLPPTIPPVATKLSITTDDAPINKNTINPDTTVNITQTPTPAPTNSPIGKMLVAKYNGSGIYDAYSKAKTGVTKQGANLGICIEALKTTNLSLNLTYRDSSGAKKIVNSVAVKY